jgi:lipoprotein-anchoring transpeptidase ErfK/SrfK
MNTNLLEAHELVVKAREALRRGEKDSAWNMAEQAVLLAPDMEDAWLILAASDPDPQEALAYAQKALEINPSSTRARKGVEWARGRLQQVQASEEPVVPSPEFESAPESSQPKAGSSNRKWIYAGLFLAFLTCAVLAFAGYTAVTHPAFAAILNRGPVPTQENLWAVVNVPKASVTPIQAGAFSQGAANTPTVQPEATAVPTKRSTATPKPTLLPSEVPGDLPPSTPEATGTPGAMVMEIVEDTPTSEFVAPNPSAPLPDIATSGDGVRWIDVDLTNQMVHAYEGDVVVNSFIVSTGTWLTPTVTGQYKIYVKYRSAKMSGPGYYLPDVPYIMYFYKGYGLHGTYWHNNFGTPMSHGCVNLRTDDAGWLYNWASVGTLVNVHY